MEISQTGQSKSIDRKARAFQDVERRGGKRHVMNIRAEKQRGVEVR